MAHRLEHSKSGLHRLCHDAGPDGFARQRANAPADNPGTSTARGRSLDSDDGTVDPSPDDTGTIDEATDHAVTNAPVRGPRRVPHRQQLPRHVLHA